MLENKLSRLTMHGVIGNSTINGRYIQFLEPFRYEITCFPLPRFPPFKATAPIIPGYDEPDCVQRWVTQGL